MLEGTIVEAGSIYAGVPAKKVKDISPEKISGEIDRIANNYTKYASWFENYNVVKENNISIWSVNNYGHFIFCILKNDFVASLFGKLH